MYYLIAISFGQECTKIIFNSLISIIMTVVVTKSDANQYLCLYRCHSLTTNHTLKPHLNLSLSLCKTKKQKCSLLLNDFKP